MKTFVSIPVLGVWLSAASLSLTAAGYTADQVIKALDKDGDGKISKEEASEEMVPYFGALDTNSDGLIDRVEAELMVASAASQAQAGPVHTRPVNLAEMKQIAASMDANGDGRISKAEATEDLSLHFGNFDTNQDGWIAGEETQRLVDYGVKNHRVATAGAAEKKAEGVTGRQIVVGLDKDGDGKVSRQEASSELKPYFDNFDTNKDGFIDLAEAEVVAKYANQ